MNTYPRFDVTEFKKWTHSYKVWVKAKTTCGPTIQATCELPIKSTSNISKVHQEAVNIAKRNLDSVYNSVVATCKKRGKHDNH